MPLHCKNQIHESNLGPAPPMRISAVTALSATDLLLTLFGAGGKGNLSHSFSLEFANPTWEEVLERCQSLVNIP